MAAVYMHTINGLPARYCGQQIVYINAPRAKDVLRYSLDEIRHEQEMTRKWREKQGFKHEAGHYGHIMFYVDTPTIARHTKRGDDDQR